MAQAPRPAEQMNRRLRWLFPITVVAAGLLPVYTIALRPHGPTYGSGMTVGTIVQGPIGPTIIDQQQAQGRFRYGTPILGTVTLSLSRAAEGLNWLPFSAPIEAEWGATFAVDLRGGTPPPSDPLVRDIPEWFVELGRAHVEQVPAEVPDAAFLNGAAAVVLWRGILFNTGLVLYALALFVLMLLTWRSFRTVVVDQIRITDHRCRACGYDARGHAAETCPECGAVLAGRNTPEPAR